MGIESHALSSTRTRRRIPSTCATPSASSVAVDDAGMVYLLSKAHRRVFRFDSVQMAHRNPLVVGRSPLRPTGPATHIAFSDFTGKLALGFPDGVVSRIDPP